MEAGNPPIVEKIAFAIARSPNGSLLAISSVSVNLEQYFVDPILEILDGETNRLLFSIPQPAPIYGIAWHPNNNDLYTGDDRGTIRRWNTTTGELNDTHQLSILPILQLSWDSRGTRLISGGYDNILRVMDASGKLVYSLDLGGSDLPGLATCTHWVSYNPDGLTVVTSGTDEHVVIRDADTLSPILTLPFQAIDPVMGRWSPDGSKLAIGGNNNIAQIWDMNMGKFVTNLEGHSGRILNPAWKPTGDQLATPSADGTVRIWDVQSGKCLRIIKTRNLRAVWRVDWSSTGNLAYGGEVAANISADGDWIPVPSTAYEILSL